MKVEAIYLRVMYAEWLYKNENLEESEVLDLELERSKFVREIIKRQKYQERVNLKDYQQLCLPIGNLC